MPLYWSDLNFLPQGCFVSHLNKISRMILERKINMWFFFKNRDRQTTNDQKAQWWLRMRSRFYAVLSMEFELFNRLIDSLLFKVPFEDILLLSWRHHLGRRAAISKSMLGAYSLLDGGGGVCIIQHVLWHGYPIVVASLERLH